MKLNKTLIIAALAVGSLLAVGNAQAQDDTNKPAAGAQGMRGRGMTVDAISTQLGLTEDQKAKAKPALEDYIQKMRDLRTDTGMSQEDRRTKMKEIRDATKDKLKDILTPEQVTKWDAMGNRGRRGANANPPTDTTPKN